MKITWAVDSTKVRPENVVVIPTTKLGYVLDKGTALNKHCIDSDQQPGCQWIITFKRCQPNYTAVFNYSVSNLTIDSGLSGFHVEGKIVPNDPPAVGYTAKMKYVNARSIIREGGTRDWPLNFDWVIYCIP